MELIEVVASPVCLFISASLTFSPNANNRATPVHGTDEALTAILIC
jgi:hypothetical protein